MCKATIHVRTVRHRISERVIGFRLEAAIPNQAGRKMKPLGDGDFYATKETATSYRKPYLIAESSDHSFIRAKEIKSFLDELRRAKFDQFEFEDKYDGDPLDVIATNL